MTPTDPQHAPAPHPRKKYRNLAQGVVEQISSSIVQGQLKPGDKLPTESAIMDMHGVSRTVVREAISAPGYDGIRDGEHSVVDLRNGFGIVIGEKRSEDTLRNIRYDERDVTLSLSIHVPVPSGVADSYSEMAEQCARAVRECLFEDRTLDGQVQMTDVMRVLVFGPAFRFEVSAGVSPLIARVDMTVRIRVFERD